MNTERAEMGLADDLLIADPYLSQRLIGLQAEFATRPLDPESRQLITLFSHGFTHEHVAAWMGISEEMVHIKEADTLVDMKLTSMRTAFYLAARAGAIDIVQAKTPPPFLERQELTTLWQYVRGIKTPGRIARLRAVAEWQVKEDTDNLMEKLQARNISLMVRRACETGLLVCPNTKAPEEEKKRYLKRRSELTFREEAIATLAHIAALPLTNRQCTLLGLLSRGHTTGQTAQALGIKQKEVGVWTGHILYKLGVDTIEEATDLAINMRIIPIWPDRTRPAPELDEVRLALLDHIMLGIDPASSLTELGIDEIQYKNLHQDLYKTFKARTPAHLMRRLYERGVRERINLDNGIYDLLVSLKGVRAFVGAMRVGVIKLDAHLVGILEQNASGASAAEIAGQFGVTPAMVQHYYRQIKDLLDVSSMKEAVEEARAMGIKLPGDS